jgi:hypothetical protein
MLVKFNVRASVVEEQVQMIGTACCTLHIALFSNSVSKCARTCAYERERVCVCVFVCVYVCVCVCNAGAAQ